MSVGYVYDPVQVEHDTGGHEESSERLLAVMRLLGETGLVDRLESVPGRAAGVEEVTLVHTREYVAALERFARSGGGWVTLDTVMASGSFRAALHAAGSSLSAVEAVLTGQVTDCFALVRPPGHHACPEQAMGFCLLNNAAIAARYAQQFPGVGRVLIVDFDVHHGNGTQEVFYSDPTVLYFSVHEYGYFFYPGTGGLQETGSGPGAGFTVNVPLPVYCGDSEYRAVFAEVLEPVARRFRPDLLLVSAGYDSHWADPLTSGGGRPMRVSVPGFASLARSLHDLARELCEGRMVMVLEGGYSHAALAASVRATFDVLLGQPPPAEDPLDPPPRARSVPDVASVLSALRRIHRL